MKKISTLLLLGLLGYAGTNAQNTFPATGSAGIGTTTPSSSSILDIQSTSKGILIPRMTLAQRNAIVSPAAGLIIFQTNGTQGLYFFNGSSWNQVGNGVGANKMLNNLNATAINLSLLPGITNSIDLGSATKTWKNGFFSGNLTIANGTQGVGKVLTSDANGLASWATPITGVTTINAISGTSNVNGATISGNALTLTPADATNGGVVTAGTQTIGGAKTFTNDVSVNGVQIGAGPGGWYNTRVGVNALMHAGPGGDNNTAAGYYSLHWNTTGNSNAAYGFYTLMDNSTGNFNTAIGNLALRRNTTGQYNSGIGLNALAYNTTGNWNAAIGGGALGGNTTGSANTGIGMAALSNNTTGNGNIAIGNQANVAADNLENAIAIGNGAIVDASNKAQIGSSTLNTVQLGTGANVTLETGLIKLNGGSPGAGKILTSDSNGLASWATPVIGVNSIDAISGTPTANGATINNGVLTLTAADGTHGGVLTNGYQVISGGKEFLGDLTAQGVRIGAGNNPTGYNTVVGNSSLPTGSGIRNTAVGRFTMTFNNGDANTAVGEQALTWGTGHNNSVLGQMSFWVNEGSQNVGVGQSSGMNNGTGNNNTALGTGSFLTNTSGSNNTVVGFSADVASNNLSNATAIGAGAIAGASNTIQLGDPNVTNVKTAGTYTAGAVTYPNAHGVAGQVLSTTGSGTLVWTTPAAPVVSPWTVSGNNIFNSNSGNVGIGTTTPSAKFEVSSDSRINSLTIGKGSGNIEDNTAFGVSALIANVVGNGNTAIGYGGLSSNTGSYNTAVGNFALRNNTTGLGNIAVGHLALINATTAYKNTAVGTQSMEYTTTGGFNSAFGNYSLRNTNGTANVGYGDGTLQNNTTGNNNTAIGAQSLQGNVSGSSNTVVGANANVSADNLTNATALGAYSIVNASNKVRLGNSSVSVIEGQVAYSFPSDARFKNNIEANVPGLDFIKDLKPVTYKFDTRKFDQHLMQNMPKSDVEKRMQGTDYTTSSNVIHSGFLAQDIEVTCKKLGYDFDGLHIADPKNPTDNYSVAYSQFVMPLVKAVQELASANEALKTENAEIKKENAEMRNDIAAIKAMLTSQAAKPVAGINQKEVSFETATLDQNVPNPPAGSMTRINYNIPNGAARAELVIVDNAGRRIKTINLNTFGKGVLNVNTKGLASGTYTYTMYVDGKMIDSKKMVIAK